MPKRTLTFRKAERGQSLNELAITMAFMLILLAGIADIGRALSIYISLRDAAQEGALYGTFAFSENAPDSSVAIVSPDVACSRIRTRIIQNSNNLINLAQDTDISIQIAKASSPDVWVSCSPTISIQPCAKDRIRVAVNYNGFSIATPFLGTLLGTQQVEISAAVEDRILAPTKPQASVCP